MNIDNKFVRISFTLALATLALFLLAETVQVVKTIGKPTPATNTIVVSGKGSAFAVPDIAVINYSIKKTEPTVLKAQTEETKTENAVSAFLKKQKIADKDVRTTSYSTRPHYEYNKCGNFMRCTPKISGYDVTQSVEVKIHNLSIVSAVLGGLGDLGVTNFSGPSFKVDDPTVVEAQARGTAIAKAKEKAQVLAKQLGVRIVRITKYTETPQIFPVYNRLMTTGSSSAPTPVTPTIPKGQNEYKVQVSVTYEIR